MNTYRISACLTHKPALTISFIINANTPAAALAAARRVRVWAGFTLISAAQIE